MAIAVVFMFEIFFIVTIEINIFSNKGCGKIGFDSRKNKCCDNVIQPINALCGDDSEYLFGNLFD